MTYSRIPKTSFVCEMDCYKWGGGWSDMLGTVIHNTD